MRRIVCVGGRAWWAFTAILVRKMLPSVGVEVHERNPYDATYGFGVVFSDETLVNIARADPESVERIEAEFRYWSDLEIRKSGDITRTTGHGFAAFPRLRILQILADRAMELGAEVRFESEVSDVAAWKATWWCWQTGSIREPAGRWRSVSVPAWRWGGRATSGSEPNMTSDRAIVSDWRSRQEATAPRPDTPPLFHRPGGRAGGHMPAGSSPSGRSVLDVERRHRSGLRGPSMAGPVPVGKDSPATRAGSQPAPLPPLSVLAVPATPPGARP